MLDECKGSRGYAPIEYMECFERAFEAPVYYIDFKTMDFRDVRPRLQQLAEYIDGYYDEVEYPPAEPGEVIPFITEESRTTIPAGFEYSLFTYTPPIWHDEARRTLLFAHKLCYEDPLPQILGPIVETLDRKDSWHAAGLLKPSKVHPQALELLRTMLLNVQMLERLIRSGIVIPHCLLTSRIPDYLENYDNDKRFTDRMSLERAENFANTLGALLSEGYLDSFRLPPYIVRMARQLAPKPGDWEKIGWFQEVFDEISVHDKKLRDSDPLRLWSYHLYRIALNKRYLDSNGMGYAPHFQHKDGYQLYAILEAADFATRGQERGEPESFRDTGYLKDMDVEYSENMKADFVFVSRLDSFMRPKLDVLKDEDLVSIRMNEPLLETWRHTVRETLEVVRKCESDTGRSYPELAAKELRDHYSKWRTDSKRELKNGFLRDAFDFGKGSAISIVSNILLHKATSGATLAIPAVRRILGTTDRVFAWRSNQNLYNRHFLSVL